MCMHTAQNETNTVGVLCCIADCSAYNILHFLIYTAQIWEIYTHTPTHTHTWNYASLMLQRHGLATCEYLITKCVTAPTYKQEMYVLSRHLPWQIHALENMNSLDARKVTYVYTCSLSPISPLSPSPPLFSVSSLSLSFVFPDSEVGC